MQPTAEIEQHAIVTDASRRLAELQAVRDVLQPDASDPAVAAELACIESELRAAVAALGREQESEQ